MLRFSFILLFVIENRCFEVDSQTWNNPSRRETILPDGKQTPSSPPPIGRVPRRRPSVVRCATRRSGNLRNCLDFTLVFKGLLLRMAGVATASDPGRIPCPPGRGADVGRRLHIYASLHPYMHPCVHACIHALMHPCMHASLHASMHP